MNYANSNAMRRALIDELKNRLPASDSRLRKHWAQRIVDEKMDVASLMVLLHGHAKTAQRFTWLIGDLLEEDRTVVAPVVPMLFALRDEMPFPGMRRTVAKCFWYLGVPPELEADVIPVLLNWLNENAFAVGIKHYCAKALFDLAVENRIDPQRFERILRKQARHENGAHASRMESLRTRLASTIKRKRES